MFVRIKVKVRGGFILEDEVVGGNVKVPEVSRFRIERGKRG